MSETVQSIIEEMDSAVAEVETATSEALKQAEVLGTVHPSRPGQDVSALQAELLRLETEKAELANRGRNEALAERLADLRERGMVILEAERQALEAQLYRAQQAEGPQGEAWAEAERRRVFIAEDVVNTPPGDIPEYYRLAVAAGDKVGAWLIARYAERHLAELQQAEVKVGEYAGDAARALGELRMQFTSPARAAHRVALARLAALEPELTRPRGEVEQGDAKREFAARMGLKAEHVPDLDFAP